MRNLLVVIFIAVMAFAGPAYAWTCFLEDQWKRGSNNMCKYSNGTVLNMGIKLCPLSIECAGP